MTRARAVIGSALFLVVAPGIVTGLVPWIITGWQQGAHRPAALVLIGAIVTAVGCLVLLTAFGRFALEGRGTPAPQAPTQTLVISGPYRHVRNPMYLALQAIIVGQTLLLDRPILLVYAAGVAAATFAFVKVYEEPALARRYGEQYEQYRRSVPGWLLRWPSKRRRPAGGGPGRT